MNDPRGGGGGQHQHQQLCDDGSNLISAVQSAVTHFFGQQHEPSSPVNEEMPEEDGSSTPSQSSPTKQSQSQQQSSSTSETASITILPSSSSNSSSINFHQDSSSSNNNNILLTSRARSMSPSLSNNTESLYYYPDMYYYYNNPLLLNCNSPTSNSNYYYGTYEQEEDNGAWSYFETSDFSSQTWLNVLSETDTIHYCGAGAAILTAVIIIHPLALIGAAATAAVGASAAWAVGLFHDLDKGYQIWNHDDFGMLFWEEEGTANCATNVAGATNVVVDPCNFVANTAAIVGGCSSSATTTTTAAIATWGSQQIIQRNEEELRRAFLLEQEEKKKALLLLEQQQQQGQGVVEEEAKLGDDDEMDDRNIVTLPQQQQQQSHVETKLQSISLQETNRLIRINSAPVKELSSSSIRVKSSRKQNQQQQVLLPPRHQQHQPPNKATQHPTNPLHPPTSILSTQQSLDRHYPPLEIRVVSEVEFMDLNTIEFFQVFFSDEAPYSMKDFQQKRGDVDIVYGTWKDVQQNLSSFKQQPQQAGLVLPFPPNSYTRERVLTFNTLTKSYFGPAYAKATKIQRATQLSKHLLVIENMTQLSEVPFSDRFQVLERWIVEAVKSSSSHDGSGSSSGGGGGGLYTCKLTVYAEVVMISSCRFEPQIRKKASETFTELTLGWCKLATKALEATKEQKRKRMRKHEQQQQQEQLDDRNDYSVVLVGDDEASWQDEEERSKKSRVGEVLFAKHQQKFQELDDLISHGDGIEVMHSIKAGAHSAFAQVLETPPSSLSHSSSSGLLKLRDGTVVEVARRRRTTNANNNSSTITPFGRIPRKMNRSFLLRKLSSRVRSRQQSR